MRIPGSGSNKLFSFVKAFFDALDWAIQNADLTFLQQVAFKNYYTAYNSEEILKIVISSFSKDT